MANIDFELQNFSALIAEEVKAILVQDEGGFRDAAFAQVVLDYLVIAQETGNTQVCTCVHRNAAGNRLRQLNGYALWDGYETLDLFVTEFRGEGQIYTLEKSRVASAFNLLSRYLAFTTKGDYSCLEESAEEQEFLRNFSHFQNDLLRVRLILLTDGMVRQEAPAEEEKSEEGPTVIKEIWDVERLYQLWSSQRKREPIEVNIHTQFKQRVPVLESAKDGYQAYVAIVPGSLLADLYDVYGSRLLEQNVRVFLQNLGKVNQGIRKTILGEPEMFLAYNNGISTTATELELVKDKESGQLVLGRVKGLQIVNGGQTTSSIYYARKKDRADLSKVLVQMKVTVLGESEHLEKMVSNISRYANSQNKVSEVDLTSNQAFHVLLEELSRTTWAPVSGENRQQTRWYYERVKGQYKEELNKEHTRARKLSFKRKNPAGQVVRKEQLAKYHQAWAQLPHWVVRGSQKNYMNMMDDASNVAPDRTYFREMIGKAILFRSAERIYGKKPNAMGDLRYLVVPYSLAWLNHHTKGRIDLQLIWSLQELSGSLHDLLRTVLLKVNEFFVSEKPAEYALVSEWAKKDACWEALKEKSPEGWNININSIQSVFHSKKEAKSNDQLGSDEEARLRSIPIETWEHIEQFGRETRRLNPYQIGLARNISRRLGKNQSLTAQMIEHGVVLVDLWESQV